MNKSLVAFGLIVGAILLYGAIYKLNQRFSDSPVDALTSLLEYSRFGDFERARLLVTNESGSTGSAFENEEEYWQSSFRYFAEIDVSESQIRVLKQLEREAVILIEPAKESKKRDSYVFTLYRKASGWKVKGSTSKDLYDLNEKIMEELASEK